MVRVFSRQGLDVSIEGTAQFFGKSPVADEILTDDFLPLVG